MFRNTQEPPKLQSAVKRKQLSPFIVKQILHTDSADKAIQPVIKLTPLSLTEI